MTGTYVERAGVGRMHACPMPEDCDDVRSCHPVRLTEYVELVGEERHRRIAMMATYPQLEVDATAAAVWLWRWDSANLYRREGVPLETVECRTFYQATDRGWRHITIEPPVIPVGHITLAPGALLVTEQSPGMRPRDLERVRKALDAAYPEWKGRVIALHPDMPLAAVPLDVLEELVTFLRAASAVDAAASPVS